MAGEIAVVYINALLLFIRKSISFFEPHTNPPCNANALERVPKV
jgi:hypothetical protein